MSPGRCIATRARKETRVGHSPHRPGNNARPVPPSLLQTYQCAVRGFVRTHFLPFTRSDRESRTTLHLLNLWKHLTLRGFETLFLHFSFCLFAPTDCILLCRHSALTTPQLFCEHYLQSSSFCTSRVSRFGRNAVAVLQFAVEIKCRYHEPTQESGTPSLLTTIYTMSTS
ncbi:hypothetical protein BKA58DRAFT_161966 [Alternaria rosae]|uniref:uncharacterized protein n=1 Tax=Alternaria rosae TaxID=1187941 RepID=UPI001E8E4CB0|nr:uncharacterized protein BKA58DRAFT_161966 [Alternaria rosae]KAH6873170.1 hypothetical protein BKA58DRAFT_161966 [Alternaria rosae]